MEHLGLMLCMVRTPGYHNALGCKDVLQILERPYILEQIGVLQIPKEHMVLPSEHLSNGGRSEV